MRTIHATFENGVFKPAEPLDLPPRAEVRLTIDLLPPSPLTVKELNFFLRGLPSLGDDAETFSRDVREIRASFPSEENPWD